MMGKVSIKERKLRGVNKREGVCTTQVAGLQSHVLVIDAQD